MIRRFLVVFLFSGTGLVQAFAADQAPSHPVALSDELARIRSQIDLAQRDWFSHLKEQKNARIEVKKFQKLIWLQHRQKDLVGKRVHELEKTLSELSVRKAQLGEKVVAQQALVMRLMKAMDISQRQLALAGPVSLADSLPELEKREAPKRKVIAHLADHGLKEIEVLRIDLSDLGQLEGQILDEKQQVTYLSHDLEEQESVLALNQRLKNDLLKKEKTQSLTQLENYRKLKTSETQIEHLISEFNARAELENVASTEKRIAKMMSEGAFAKARGRLPLPLAGGKVVSAFGKGFDALSGLQIFKKGVEISGEKSQSVLAVSAGRVAFSGELPNYGQVIIIDHGDHFYTLVGHLGAVLKQTKDWVSPGDSIGQMDQKGTPVYFEIRSRNVAVNPLQWVVN